MGYLFRGIFGLCGRGSVLGCGEVVGFQSEGSLQHNNRGVLRGRRECVKIRSGAGNESLHRLVGESTNDWRVGKWLEDGRMLVVICK